MKKLIALILLLVLIIQVPLASAAATELFSTSLFSDANLIAYYRLENGNDSKGIYNLTQVNGSFVTGLFNNGFLSTATNQYLTTSSPLGINGSTSTYMFWVNCTSSPGGTGNYYWLEQNNDLSKASFYITYEYNAGITSLNYYRIKQGVVAVFAGYNVALSTSTWHHIAMTYSATSGLLSGYYDGNFTTSTVTTGNGTSATGNKFATGLNAGTTDTCKKDDYAVFNRVLSASEISDVYNGTAVIQTKKSNIIDFSE